MAKFYLFSDEAGDFEFAAKPNVSKYLIICTVCTPSLDVGGALVDLRHDLIRKQHDLGDCFHATSDKQEVRDAVYDTLTAHEFTVQAQICDKSKAYDRVKESRERFYKYPWYYLLKHGVSKHVPQGSHLYATAASIGTKKERQTYINNIKDVLWQNVRGATFSVDFRPAMADPCLQVADYCAWAIQRKWERGDRRSYDLIRSRITYEYSLWR
ncbi:DUF3800 domain-containing protein [Mangrovicella endophytica]|uniref:DUF3800 domain-containing protein n=1 Tax=Mangrovicella endophytica TaxID=2066697 RepID=UPI000C9E669B|nr:DUF3800 domain-containing protein [Mangrovicella endophytica]